VKVATAEVVSNASGTRKPVAARRASATVSRAGGIAANPAMNQEWGNKTLKDEPVIKGNLRGYVVYGATMDPDSRSTHFFINLVDNSEALDSQGFAAFGEVIDGMDVVDKLAYCEYRDQRALAHQNGMDRFKKQFPDADYILRAYIR